MSKAYDEYLEDHIKNVKKAFNWMIDQGVLDFLDLNDDKIEKYLKVIYNHDHTKCRADEYEAYDRYFYPDEYEDDPPFSQRVEEYHRAWLEHIHRNPHHWQHWVLIDDNGSFTALPMPEVYVIEMICDWWSFSWKKGNLYEIFDWVDENSPHILLADDTIRLVEKILNRIRFRLNALNGYWNDTDESISVFEGVDANAL